MPVGWILKRKLTLRRRVSVFACIGAAGPLPAVRRKRNTGAYGEGAFCRRQKGNRFTVSYAFS